MNQEYVFTLMPHLAIEFMTKGIPNGLITEYSMSSKRRNKVYESYGVFPNCEDMASQIYKCIRKDGYTGRVDSFKCDNSFFSDMLYIVYSNKVDEMAYRSDLSDFGDDGRFSSIVLMVNPKIPANLHPLIMHELQHAYEDFNLRLKNNSLDSKMDKKGYFRNNFIEPETVGHMKMKTILYFLNPSEVNAYTTQINREIRNINGSFMSVQNLYDRIKDIMYYKIYMQIFDTVKSICSTTNKEEQQTVMNYVNTVKPNTFKTFNQFSKWLTNRAIKVKRKIDSVVAKVAYDHFKSQLWKKVSPPGDDEELLGIMTDMKTYEEKERRYKPKIVISEEQLKDTVARTIRRFIRKEKKKNENME